MKHNHNIIKLFNDSTDQNMIKTYVLEWGLLNTKKCR